MASFTIDIPRWHPACLNQMKGHWSNGHRLKQIDKAMIAAYSTAIPKAEGKRRVSLHIILDKGQRGPDPDAYNKSLNDALVHAGLLVNDNRQYVENAPVTYSRDPKGWGSRITLEDMEDRQCGR